MSSAHSSAPRGSSRRDVAFSLPPPQSGRLIEELRSCDAEEEDRCVAREVRDVLDEFDEHGLGPLQVVDDDDLRTLDGTASSSRRNASCVSGGELPMTDSGSTSFAMRISTSGQ